MKNNTNILKFSQFINENKWNLIVDMSSKFHMLKRIDDNDEFEKEGDLGEAINSFIYFIINKFKNQKDEIIKLTSESDYDQLRAYLRFIQNIDGHSYETLEEFQEEFNETWSDIYDWCDKHKIWLNV